jgi:multiple sugar transport system substrate-binding protein
MKEGSQWEILIAKKYGKSTFDYGISNFPAPQGGRNDVCNVSGSFWVIPTASKNQDEAFEFLTWLTADKQAAEFAAALYNIPPKIKSLEDNAFKTIVDDKMKIYIDMLMNGYVYTFPMLPIGQAYLTELTQALMDVQLGNKTAKEALDYVQERINQELKNYK